MSTPPDPQFTHGSKAQFWIGTAAAPDTLVEISERINSTGLPWSRDKADVTTFLASVKKYVFGQRDAAIPIEGPYDAYTDEVLTDLLEVDSVAFRYRPIGTGSGKPEFNGRVGCTKHEIKTEASGAGSISAELQVDGDVPRTYQA